MKKTVCVVIVLLIIGHGLSAQSKAEKIRKLFELTNTEENGKQLLDLMFGQFKRLLPRVSPSYWDSFLQELNLDEYVDLMVAIYDRYYSMEDIEQMIAFYQTDLGRKIIRLAPTITKDSFSAGMMWGAQIEKRIREKLKKDGYLDT